MVKIKDPGSTWFIDKWIEALENTADDANRLKRGQEYVNLNMVKDIRIQNGIITAKVEGSYNKHYKVEINPLKISDENYNDSGILRKM